MIPKNRVASGRWRVVLALMTHAAYDSPVLQCLRCKSDNPASQGYCGTCGAPLDPTAGPLREALETSLRMQLESSLAEKWKDRKAVEAETARAIRQELTRRARNMGAWIGAAVILWSLLMAFLAGAAYKEFTRRVDRAQANLEQVQRQIAAKRAGAAPAVDAVSPTEVRGQIQAELDERLKDRKTVETETAEAVAAKVSDWAKLLGFFVGIPLAALAVGLGFWGVKTFAGFSSRVNAALERSISEMSAVQERASGEMNAAKQRAMAEIEVMRRLTDATRQDVEKARAESERLLAQLPKVRELAGEVAGLNTKVRQIEEKIAIAYRGALTKHEAQALSESLESFRAYMQGVGFRDKPGSIKVMVKRDVEGAYYSPDEKRMYVGSRFVADSDVVFMQYVHHAVEKTTTPEGEYRSIGYGLAYYFPCSFHNDPAFGKVIAELLGESGPCHRNLANSLSFQEGYTPDVGGKLECGESWGGAFWELRNLIAQKAADELLYAAWSALKPPDIISNDGGKKFVSNLLDQYGTTGGTCGPEIRAIFERRGLKL